MQQCFKAVEKEERSEACDSNVPHLNNDSSSSSESDNEVQKHAMVRRRGMPIKRFRRILVGLVVTLLVVSPMLLAIILRNLFDDSTKYVFHQVECPEKSNELRIVQVFTQICVCMHHAKKLKIHLL